MKTIVIGLFFLMGFGVSHAVNLGDELPDNPIMFVTQYPVAGDFATIASTFGNHRGSLGSAGRGGDLYIRYTDGTLRNLTREAGYGAVGFQGAQAISVRDPAVHWSGERALFSMVIGAPTEQHQSAQYYWQIYEVTGFAQGEQVSISRVDGQATDYNNISPIYGSDDAVIFTSDMPRTKNRYNYPQKDEYESTPTNTGLWKLDNGAVTLMQHSPSGSFNPSIDSFGRILFTRWDHLQRDQQASPVNNSGAFNYQSELPGAVPLDTVVEVFPEPRTAEEALLDGTNLVGHRFNHFFPWQLNQDGTEEETLNHVGRHEFHSFFSRSINDDTNVRSFNVSANRPNQNSIFNVFQLHENPQIPGQYLAVDAPEFQTHGAGQLIRFELPLGADPSLVEVDYLSHEDTRFPVPDDQSAPATHVGFFRNPMTAHNGVVLVAHTSETRRARNEGSTSNPNPRYDFSIKTIALDDQGNWVPGQRLTTLGDVNISFYNPSILVTYDGPLWELSPVEVVARDVPPFTEEQLFDPELQIFAEENIDLSVFQNYLKRQNLAVVVMRDVTTRDELDLQQPFNLKVADSPHQSIGAPGQVYEVSHMQFFQGDQIRAYGGVDNPSAGQRVLAQFQHDTNAEMNNIPLPDDAPPSSAKVYEDGSVAFFVPTRRASSWQSLSPSGEAVVRERYWLTFQPGEIRACGGCHGVNQVDQTGQLPSVQKADAFRGLLRHWDDHFEDLIFANDFE